MASARPRAKTQAERRAETRAALLDATVESLVTYGYTGTTTGRIAELAGVSRGAQTPYFRSRADLLSAAVTHLAELRLAAVRERFSGKAITVEEGLDALWEEHQGDAFDALLELWIASRTDDEMREHLVRIERDVGVAIVQESARALGPIADRPDFNDDMIYILATMRGLSMMRISHGVSDRTLNRRWSEIRERLAQVLT
ncbi:MAG TPA: TetR family transcriptional regulator [Solirubrobacterales bacterium]|nr:TetR family transcriptional regulator [Solirubrobacterales bacterium]HMU25820.1 TetR family transcriptional regulator [Solirubrobacterales bacterium]HMX70211.1 TetR family transcriptional regulator [Solirubrobacterales bacterium]HNA24571.1 TetR family transcriptional regulator [Solirubrobacterales bacterium]HNA43583.1 TetR family transcriptional regulator [Solirubrobacterales bacterium]